MLSSVFSFKLFQCFAFVLGAIVGSFLNVVIYRLPLGLSINRPRRSFCPHCKCQIPWYQNIPLVSWVLLRGKCAKCGAPIAFRYFLVELLTAELFFVIWSRFFLDTPSLILPYWVLVSILIAATFIDFDHFIIPDELTFGGAVAGLIFSFVFPSLMGMDSHGLSLFWSIVGAVSGSALLWMVRGAGKLAFGRKRLRFDPPVEFKWTRQGEDAELVVGEEKTLWSEIFSSDRDQLIMETESPLLDEQPIDADAKETRLHFFYNKLLLPGREILLDNVATISGKVRSMVKPREAMGLGDVKFMACIGAFLGWRAVLFTVGAASFIGAIAGISLMIVGRRDASGRIPFGPYLALGALLWIFVGPSLVDWYLSLFRVEM